MNKFFIFVVSLVRTDSRLISMRKINELLLSIAKWGLIIMVPVLVIITFVQVVLRYGFMSPLRWPEEMGRFLLVWISMLGSVYALREGLHVSISFLRDRLTGLLRYATTVVVHVSLLGFFLFCTYYGAIYAYSQWFRTTPAMEIPGTFPISAISVGCAIMFMIDLELFIDELRGLHSRKNSPLE